MNYWVVGADWDGDDQTEEFISQGTWQNGYSDKFLHTVGQIQVGDRIAIKSVYRQKHNLPFNNFGCDVSCMKIKAVGDVIENLQDGRTLKVNWTPQEDVRVIYYYTYRQTVTRVANEAVKEWIFSNSQQPFGPLEQLYKERSLLKKEKLSDETILGQFHDVINFHFITQDPIAKKLFIEFARHIHQLPMDWWVVKNDKKSPVRFGINNDHIQGTIAYIAQVGFDSNGTFLVPNGRRSDFLNEGEEIRLDPNFLEGIKEMEFSELTLSRAGRWPKDYLGVSALENPASHGQDNNIPKNQILFGPAGTGKTYHTVNRALEILEFGEELNDIPREQLKKRFDEYINNGRIQFVTFHQSFSYEDFVEGIQAKTSQAGEVQYSVEPGIFRQFCMKAQGHNYFSTLQKGEKINENEVFAINVDSVDLRKPNGNIISFSKNLLGTLIAALLNKSITIEDIRQKKAIEKLALLAPQANQLFLEPYIVNGYNSVLSQLLKTITERVMVQEACSSPHVLIIDEINRGNISRIFGELITLIEESKREGAEEGLSVVLPYSKTVFSVPNNVYIIGTMNSSDRSLTGLDIALRRRFTFIEMQPDPGQLAGISIDGVDIKALLTVINQRIEVLLDRDHCIGHAYFMPLRNQHKQTVRELGFIFKQRIIPLLQEYFYDDWERIDWVLGSNGMVTQQFSQTGDLEKLFPKAALDKVHNHCWQVNPVAQFDTDIGLYQRIIDIRDAQ